MHSNKQNAIDYIEAGDIGAAVGFKDIKTGDTMSSEKHPIILESMNFPDPVIGIAVEPKTKADVDKLGMSLAKLAEEDPTFQVKTDEASGQTIISGMGELHLDIIVDRLRREFKVEVNQGQPQVEYKEALTAVADHREVYKKQSGGRGKFADIVFTIEPAEAGKSGLEFISVIKGGNVPKEFIPGVEKGIRTMAESGLLAGFPVIDFSAELYDGAYHDVDSSVMAFEIAARAAFRQIKVEGKLKLLEPMMKVEVVTPDEYLGSVIGDLNSRRGMILGQEMRGNAVVANAMVPLANMFGYVNDLRSSTQGRAQFTMTFDHYAATPRAVADEVISKLGGA